MFCIAYYKTRYERLDTLRVVTEGYNSSEGLSICRKASKAEDMEHFTGIIRLTFQEKDFLGYILEDEFLTDYERGVIEFYIRR